MVQNISLLVHPQHQAKDLGPMVKKGIHLTDWRETQLPGVKYSSSSGYYLITQETKDTIVLEHEWLTRWHGREKSDHEDAETMLKSLPDQLWTQSPTDVGFCKNYPEISFELTCDDPIWRPQYKHKPKAEEGIKDTIEGLLTAGVLEYADSNWNTPILPVEKQNTGKFRMAHDLRTINQIIKTPTLPVPNPYTSLNEITQNQSWYTCIDLANAFFCLPLAEHLRDIFSFTYRGRQIRYSRIPQGFILSPGIFNQALKDMLQGVNLPKGTTLIQYVDDLLLAAETAEQCIQATHAVLNRLYEQGFKVNKSKLQVCRREVTFLGRVLSAQGSGLSSQHRTSILQHAKPITVKDMLSFLGLAVFSRNYIPAYAELTRPLREMVRKAGPRELRAKLAWDTETEKAFIDVKSSLSMAADLAKPDYDKQFFLDVSQGKTTVN